MKKYLQKLVMLLPLWSCSDKTEQQFDINQKIVVLLQDHNYNATINNNRINPQFEDDITIETNIVQQKPDSGIIVSQLDVIITLKDGTAIYESFGDIGDDATKASISNFNNFISNDFHVMLSAFNNKKEEGVEIMDWNIRDKKYKAYLGNYTIKAEKEIHLPENLLESLEMEFRKKTLSKDTYLCRFYFSKMGDEIYGSELFINNVNDVKSLSKLEQLNWENLSSFYSVRQFFILKRID